MVLPVERSHMCGYLISECVHGLQLFVGGLDLNVTDEDLKTAFSPYGELTAKVIEGKSYGFVTYTTKVSAEEAMIILKGSQLGDNAIRVICARLVSNKQDEANDGIPWDPGGVHGSGVQRNCLGTSNIFWGRYIVTPDTLGQVGLDVMGHGSGNGWAVDGNKRRSYTGRRASKNRIEHGSFPSSLPFPSSPAATTSGDLLRWPLSTSGGIPNLTPR